MTDHPRLPIHKLLDPAFGVGPDVTLRIFTGNGEVEGELKAHGIILALGSYAFKELLYSKSGELVSWKVVEVRGASLKTTKWMVDFLYSKPAVKHDWNDASAQEIFQLASLADQFHLTELQEEVIPSIPSGYYHYFYDYSGKVNAPEPSNIARRHFRGSFVRL